MLNLLTKIERQERKIDNWLREGKNISQFEKIPEKIWQPQEKQKVLLEACGLLDALSGGEVQQSVCETIGYGGAAFGGKTEGLVAIGLIACMMVPGVQVGYFRRTFKELEGADGPISRSQELYRQGGGKYNKVDHRWKYLNGAALHFCHCHTEMDVFNYQSQAFDILLIDEATHFSWFILDYLITRNRTSKYSQLPHPFRVMATNPGGIGHLWYLKLFDVDERRGPPLQVKETLNPNDQMEESYFIPAFIRDNPAGTEKDPDYEKRLMRRDPVTARALRDGDWSVFAGQMFGEFSKRKHTCPPFEIPASWPRWLGIDWGFAAPWACYWITKNPISGRVYVYRELYKTGITDPQQARLILEYTGPEEVLGINYGDPSMWARSTKGEEVTSSYDQYINQGVLLHKGDNSHANKTRKMHAILADLYDGLPGLIIFDTCPHAIRTIPALMRDPKNPEDLLDGQEEHSFDAIAYGLTGWTEPDKPKEKEESVRENPWTLGRGLRNG